MNRLSRIECRSYNHFIRSSSKAQAISQRIQRWCVIPTHKDFKSDHNGLDDDRVVKDHLVCTVPEIYTCHFRFTEFITHHKSLYLFLGFKSIKVVLIINLIRTYRQNKMLHVDFRNSTNFSSKISCHIPIMAPSTATIFQFYLKLSYYKSFRHG